MEEKSKFISDVARLDFLIKQLEKCKKERDKLLSTIDDLSKKGQLEQNKDLIRKKMQTNLVNIQQIVDELKKLKAKI